MPKPPPVERFNIVCHDIEVSALGTTIAILTKLGLTKISFDLVTEVNAFRRKVVHDIKAEDFLAEWVKDHPTFKAHDAVAHFKTEKRTAGAAYTALRMLTQKKTIRKLGEGNYSRIDVKALARPKKKSKVGVSTKDKFKIKNEQFLLAIGRRNHGRFNSASAKKLFEADGRSQTSVGPCVNHLLKDKLIKRVGEGEYVLLAAATKAKKPKAAAPPPVKANGSHALAVETPNG